MAIDLLYFSTSDDFARYVMHEIGEAKKTILSYTQKLNDASKRFDALPKSGGKNNSNKSKWTGQDLSGNTKQREVEGFKILINPTPNYELSILDEAIKSSQERLEAFEKIDKHLLPGLKNRGMITAIFEDGLPIAFMMYNEEQ
jgi:hypothetical protein